VGVTVTPDKAAAHFPVGPLEAPPAPHPGGHIHRSWVVATRRGRYLLQRLNTDVFGDLAVLQDNTVRVADHLRHKGLETPWVVLTTAGDRWLTADDGSAWRAFEFLDGRHSADPIESPADAEAVGRAFGRFTAALADLPGPPLAPTIPGFHNLQARWEAFCAVEAAAPADRVRASNSERAAVAAHAHLATALTGRALGVAHGDAKAANVLLDVTGEYEPAVVDLDTVGPAPVVIDAGDLIRSCTVQAAEDETELDKVVLQEALLEAVIGGWLAGLAGELDVMTEMGARAEAEVAHVIPAAQAICWEQAVRFLADYLDGDRYYPAARPTHNLDRARTQLRLLDQLLAGEARLQAVVARLWPGGR
jgi:N-acetylhexosamine 1-kinase